MNQQDIAAQIRNALKLRKPERSHAVLFEATEKVGTPQATFADAVSVALWPKAELEVEGYAIRTDATAGLVDLSATTALQSTYQFCHRWWLLAPKDCFSPSAVPDGWGLLELDPATRTLRKRVAAPEHEPRSLTNEFIAAMLRRHAGLDEAMARSLVQTQVEKARREIQERADALVETRVDQRTKRAESALSTLEAIRARTGIDLTTFTPQQSWIRAIQFLVDNPDYKRAFTVSGLEGLRVSAASLIREIDGFSEASARGRE
ncbi:hypothetical protein ACW0US_18110 [Xanthomonas euvesicatoria]